MTNPTMKKSYLMIAGSVIAIIVLIVVIVLVSGNDGEDDEITQPVDVVNIEDLAQMQLNPSDNYIEELQSIILNDPDPYVKERGIFTLTDIALRENDSDLIIDFLKGIANDESHDEIRTAAYANIDLIRRNVPLPSMGSMELAISGEIKEGGTISLIATITAATEVSDTVVGIEKLPLGIEPLSFPVINVELEPGVPLITEHKLKLIKTGTYIIPVSLMLSLDRIDSELIQHKIHLTVNEASGEYTIDSDI